MTYWTLQLIHYKDSRCTYLPSSEECEILVWQAVKLLIDHLELVGNWFYTLLKGAYFGFALSPGIYALHLRHDLSGVSMDSVTYLSSPSHLAGCEFQIPSPLQQAAARMTSGPSLPGAEGSWDMRLSVLPILFCSWHLDSFMLPGSSLRLL